MTKFFIDLYNYFERHKVLLYASLLLSLLFLGVMASRVKFEENVTRFFPDTKDAVYANQVFENLKIKDKIIVMLTTTDSTATTDRSIEASEELTQRLSEQSGDTLIKHIFTQVDENLIGGATDFVYTHLPLFLTADDYARFDTLLTTEGIEATMQRNYTNLLSPAGMALKGYILKDPLGIGSRALSYLQEFQVEANYTIDNGYIFSKDGSTQLLFLTPLFATGSTGKNEKLIETIESELARLSTRYPDLRMAYFGGPSVSVYNARQIKQDTLLTSGVALLIIIVFISLVFKRKRSIPLIVTPVLFGGLFALCFIYFIKGEISAIAVGAGSAVMGIALSYSIHILAHQNHVSSVQQLLKELTYPLTVGSFTTIGAFFGLTFTSSDLLRDFGLFASLALIGTTLFCLIFLPHFLKGQADVKQGVVLRLIERMNAYPFEKNRWLVGGLLAATLIGLFAADRVRFNDNMMDLNYEPEHLRQAEQQLTQLFDKKEKTVLFVSVGEDMNTAIEHYAETNGRLTALQSQGLIKGYASAQRFLIPVQEQRERLQRWKNFWTVERQAFVQQQVETAARRNGFREGSFDGFFGWLQTPFEVYTYRENVANSLLSEWQESADSLTMLITQVRMNEADKQAVYRAFEGTPHTVIFDRGFFANKWVSAINDDFYLILYLSSILIFLALLVSYGRIELTLMSFLPMAVSWIIILGLMGLLGIEFNIINIILSTFIFGIGDDFSIFIMDGLQSRYRTGRQVLNSHKTAIFFSAFTTIVGMGVLIFAQHPALRSVALISILGIIVVVLVSYTLQPILFRWLIAAPAEKGLPPYTFMGLLRTGVLFLLFFLGCIGLRILMAVMWFIPIYIGKKKAFLCRLIQLTCRAILRLAFFVRKEQVNIGRDTFARPAMIVANHQSFIDILVLLSLAPKIVMVTNHWVWNSPFFGAVIRYADFYYVGDGYEHYAERMRAKVREGYSIAVFPEGTRTYSGAMKRFHKGAFYLAETLQLDILPVVLYGNGQIIAKAQPFNIRRGVIRTEALPRIAPTDTSFGSTYQERTKRISAEMRRVYARACTQMNAPDNPAFYEALVQNYIYKGPVEEWYIRIKVAMEKNYAPFDRLVPQKGRITDIGCGYGPLCYMLAMLSPERELLGIDYDEDKIDVAKQGWLRKSLTQPVGNSAQPADNSEPPVGSSGQPIGNSAQPFANRISFLHADALACELPESDLFILNDMLHYLGRDDQRKLLLRCASRLRTGGKILVRDGNTARKGRHRLTRLTEFFSTRVLRFNQTSTALCFISEEEMRAIARQCGMNVEAMDNDAYTSNTIYVFTPEETPDKPIQTC